MRDEPTEYARRSIDDDLDELMPTSPALSLVGAKGVGKTATLSRRAATMFSLDTATDRALIGGHPELVATSDPPVFVDEWHFVPDAWNAIRRAVDKGAPGGSFLVAGSSTPRDLVNVHSGAGRFLNLTMRPLSWFERYSTTGVSVRSLLGDPDCDIDGTTTVTVKDYAAEIVRSGLPGVRDEVGRRHALLLESYIDLLVDRDVPEAGFAIRNPTALLAWLRSYAAAVSTTTDYEKIRAAATAWQADKPSKKTTQAYRDALQNIYVLEPVPAWLPAGNQLTRLRQSPKHQLVDPALAARLLNLTPANILRSPHLGPLFESLACLTVRVAASRVDARVGHLRTYGGDKEIDLIVEGLDGSIVACEVKLASHCGDDDVKHLVWLREKLGDQLVNAVVITTGERAYRRRDGVAVVPLALLTP